MTAQSKLVLPSLATIIDFFFEKSLLGYAGNGEYQKLTQTNYPEKQFVAYGPEAPYGRLVYLDCYRVNGEFSSGETIISLEPPHPDPQPHVPLWYMSYGGWCWANAKEEAIPYLKARLRKAYEAKIFCGGRGETDYDRAAQKDGALQYLTGATPTSAPFHYFIGRERICRLGFPGGGDVFWHSFHGLLLVRLEEVAQPKEGRHDLH
jgi:hypothetical protein